MTRAGNLNIKKMVGIGILMAIVVVLQLVATFIKTGSFPITLTLVPIIVGAALFGPAAGAILGATFGVVVLIFCINGLDLGGNILWLANPALTAALCIGKGTLAGFASGLVYSLFAKSKPFFGVIIAAFTCPFINTFIFIAAMFMFFNDILVSWAGGSSVISYALISLAGINFLFELAINIVLSPTIVRIITVLTKRR